MAKDLGAQVINLHDKNVSDALIRFAQQESISHVVFGQSVRSRWDILLRGSVLNRFLAEVRDDPQPYLARVARARMEDPNCRPAERLRLLRIAEQAERASPAS